MDEKALNPVTRRDFIKTGSAALASSVLAAPAGFAPGRARMRVALVGTGIRGTTMWGRDLVQNYADYVEFTGLCDINPGRVAYGKEYIGADCPTFTDFEEMMRRARPDTLIVTTVDATHHQFITRGLELGCDVITEKPLTTDEAKCQAILDTQERTGRRVIVTHNYRYSPHRLKLKQLLAEGHIGTLTSVDFHWYLDIDHGADYFRRWHGKERFSGTLFVHKASHHFDLLNWWVDSEPEEVFAYGALEYYGRNHAFRNRNCRGCPHQSDCNHFWDITEDDYLMKLYVANEHHDGYLRDGCVWAEDIDIYDKMAAQFKYASGVQVSYSCTTYSPYEGYRIAFNGTKGRLEAWIKERQPWVEEPHDVIRLTDNFGYSQIIEVPHGGGGHGGGDTRLKDKIFKDPDLPDPYGQAADARQGAMAVLAGIGARKSVQERRPVRIGDLTTLVPQAVRP